MELGEHDKIDQIQEFFLKSYNKKVFTAEKRKTLHEVFLALFVVELFIYIN